MRTALLVMQGALSVLLLVGAGLFVKSLANVKAMRMGFDAEPVLLASQNLRGMPLDDSARVRLRRTLLATAQAIPEVESASWVMTVPLLHTNATYLAVPGIDSVERLGSFSYQSTTPDYFRVMGTRILRGRGITVDDRASAPRVAVVSQSMARVLWPNQDAAGRYARRFRRRCRDRGTSRPLGELVDGARRSWRLGATMFVAFGALALVVAAVGLFAVIGYNVTQRMHELGVRVALGARGHHVVRLVIGQGLRFASAGIALGSVLALMASHWVQPLLFEQSVTDPRIYLLVGAALLLVALAASASPAIRAARAEPNAALRLE